MHNTKSVAKTLTDKVGFNYESYENKEFNFEELNLKLKENGVTETLTDKVVLTYVPIENKHVIVLDRLEVNLVPEKGVVYSLDYIKRRYQTEIDGKYKVGDNLYLSLNKDGAHGFCFSFDIHYDGKRVGKLCTNPRSMFSKSKLVLFTVEKELLYNGSWKFYENMVKKTLSLGFSSFRYLEIAYDCCSAFSRKNLMKHLHKRDFDKDDEISVRDKIFKYKKTNKPMVKDLGKSLVIGEKTSDHCLSIYTKYTPGHKSRYKDTFILDFYRANGFDMGKQIDRVEARLKNKFLRKYAVT